jgi:ribose-phosphate pyrophosphokinase
LRCGLAEQDAVTGVHAIEVSDRDDVRRARAVVACGVSVALVRCVFAHGRFVARLRARRESVVARLARRTLTGISTAGKCRVPRVTSGRRRAVFKRVAIFSGNANPTLAQEICACLEFPMGKSKVSRFSDGETFCVIQENVRGVDTYVVQPTCSPVNDSVMELLIMVDALRRASAGSITAVMPYYGYARQDRKSAPRTPITSKLVADLIVAAGVDRIVSLDLHAAQIQGFFNIPFDHLFAMPAMLESHLRDQYGSDVVIVSPDAGGVERARAYSKRLGGTLAIIDKRRERANVSEVMNIIGEVEGKNCLILDDIIDTAGTLVNAANALIAAGAKRVSACATHAVLSGPAVQRITDSPLAEVVVTNSIPLSEDAKASNKFKVVSVARLLAEAIRRIHHSDSVSSLFV